MKRPLEQDYTSLVAYTRALEQFCDDSNMTTLEGTPINWNKAITEIKEALAQPEQEPVAWGVFEGNLHDMFFSQKEAQEMADLKGTNAEVRPLYAIPQRTCVGLTDQEIWTVLQFRGYNKDTIEIAKALEAKLKEKNT